jgi:hypothetical protein
MLCVLIPVTAAEPALSETLASLIAGVVSGLVRSVVVADFRGDPALRQLCDECGCHYREAQVDGFGSAILALRSEWLMVVTPGFVLIEPWLSRLRELAAVSGECGAVFLAPPPSTAGAFVRWLYRLQPLNRRAGALVLPRARAIGRARSWDDICAAFRSLSLRFTYRGCIADLRQS